MMNLRSYSKALRITPLRTLETKHEAIFRLTASGTGNDWDTPNTHPPFILLQRS